MPAIALQRLMAPAAKLTFWAGFTAFLAYYLASELPQLAPNVFKATIVLHLAAAILITAYALSLIARRRLPASTPLDEPLLLFVLALVLAVTLGVDPRLGAETALPVLLAVVIFYVAADRGLLSRSRLRWSLLLAGGITALDALVTVLRDYRDWLLALQAVSASGPVPPPGILRVHNVGDNPNVIATVFALLLPLALVSVLLDRAWLRRLAALTIAAILALALFFTLSRAAWAGTIVGLAAAVIVATAAQTGEARRPWRASRRRIAAIAIGIAILATAALAALVASGRRPDWLFRASLDPRLDAIRVGIQIWRDHPMTGVGPGGYALLYPLYSGRNPLLTVHAHNGYVQAGVEMGLFGVAVVAVGAIAAARTLMSAIRSADERDRLLALAVMAGGIAFLVQSLGDATFEFKSVPAALAAMLALGCRARNDDTAPAAVRRSEISALTVLPLLLVLPLAAAFFDLAQKSYAVAVARADAGDWTSAAVYLDTAIRQDPHNALYSFQAGLAEAMAAGSGSPDEHLQRARAHFERGLALEPHSVIGWANYGRVLQQLGDRARARDALVRARTLGNQDVAAQLVAGTALEAMGYGNDALDAYVRALVLDSERISAPFWTATPFRLEHRRDIIERVTAERPLLPVANPAFDLTRTEPVDPRLRTRLDADLRRAQQLILAGELDRAREIIDGHLARRPDDAGALALRGDLLARAGDMEAARQAWFAAGQLGDIQALRTLGDAFDGPVPAGVSGRLEAALIRSSQVVVLDGTQFYWIGIQYYRAVFLRASPRVMLLPGEWEQVQPRPVLDAAEALTRWSAR